MKFGPGADLVQSGATPLLSWSKCACAASFGYSLVPFFEHHRIACTCGSARTHDRTESAYWSEFMQPATDQSLAAT